MSEQTIAEFLAYFKKQCIENAIESLHKFNDIPEHYYIAFVGEQGPGISPITVDFEGDLDRKDEFFEVGIPAIFEELKQNEFRPICFCTIHTAWALISVLEDGQDPNQVLGEVTSEQLENDPTKREILAITFQEPGKDTAQMYEVKRHSPHVDDDGDLVDTIDLSLMFEHDKTADSELVGKNTNVFRHYKP